MADFDMPGIGRARMGLTELSKSPSYRSGAESFRKIKRELVDALYKALPRSGAKRKRGRPKKAAACGVPECAEGEHQ